MNEFSGDDSGQIFEVSDVIPNRYSITERIVDTQSGFIVNLKNIDGRIALSVKRRLGTPPGSAILFTPDESLKLSKILASSSDEEYGASSSYYIPRINRRDDTANLLKALQGGRRLNWLVSTVLVIAAAAVGYCIRILVEHH